MLRLIKVIIEFFCENAVALIIQGCLSTIKVSIDLLFAERGYVFLPWFDYIAYTWFIAMGFICLLVNRGVLMNRKKFVRFPVPRWFCTLLMCASDVSVCVYFSFYRGTAGSNIWFTTFAIISALAAMLASCVFIWPCPQRLPPNKEPRAGRQEQVMA